MKKVLFVADIGGHEHQQYYHVGDEAMFVETYRWYKKNHPTWLYTALSWFPVHKKLDFLEAPHLQWSSNSYIYLPLLIIKFLIWHLTRISFFSQKEHEFVQTIQNNDRIHFTGGGNLSSQFRRWMYYCFFILFVAKCSGKQILLTSQTIGPIHSIDWLFGCFFFNLPSLVAIRAKTSRLEALKKYGIFLPNVKSMLDAAYTHPETTEKHMSRKENVFSIGLSIHAWKGHEKEIGNRLCNALNKLAEHYTFSITLIPHHIATTRDDTDIHFMRKLVATLKKTIMLHNDNDDTLTTIITQDAVPSDYIRTLTGNMDMLITTRYHGIIFALSAGVPVVALHYDEYYRQKNAGALEQFYGENASHYQIDIHVAELEKDFYEKLYAVIQNHKKEKELLTQIHATIKENQNTLNTILHKFEHLHPNLL